MAILPSSIDIYDRSNYLKSLQSETFYPSSGGRDGGVDGNLSADSMGDICGDSRQKEPDLPHMWIDLLQWCLIQGLILIRPIPVGLHSFSVFRNQNSSPLTNTGIKNMLLSHPLK